MAALIAPKESASKLEPLVSWLIERRGVSSGTITNQIFFDVLTLLIFSHIAVIRHLNDGFLECDVPWDEEVGLPSHPTLAADAESYVKIFKPEDERLKSTLRSFSGWSCFASQKIPCACGNWRMKLREISVDVMVNHIFEKKDGKLLIKELIGVRSPDTEHLQNHYDVKVPSEVEDGLIIPSRSQAILEVKENKIFLSSVETKESAKQINIHEFARELKQLADKFVVDFVKAT